MNADELLLTALVSTLAVALLGEVAGNSDLIALGIGAFAVAMAVGAAVHAGALVRGTWALVRAPRVHTRR